MNVCASANQKPFKRSSKPANKLWHSVCTSFAGGRAFRDIQANGTMRDRLRSLLMYQLSRILKPHRVFYTRYRLKCITIDNNSRIDGNYTGALTAGITFVLFVFLQLLLFHSFSGEWRCGICVYPYPGISHTRGEKSLELHYSHIDCWYVCVCVLVYRGSQQLHSFRFPPLHCQQKCFVSFLSGPSHPATAFMLCISSL